MSAKSRVRIHMGCGEPLQSRRWLAHAKGAAPNQQEARAQSVRDARGAVCRGAKRKS